MRRVLIVAICFLSVGFTCTAQAPTGPVRGVTEDSIISVFATKSASTPSTGRFTTLTVDNISTMGNQFVRVQGAHTSNHCVKFVDSFTVGDAGDVCGGGGGGGGDVFTGANNIMLGNNTFSGTTNFTGAIQKSGVALGFQHLAGTLALAQLPGGSAGQYQYLGGDKTFYNLSFSLITSLWTGGCYGYLMYNGNCSMPPASFMSGPADPLVTAVPTEGAYYYNSTSHDVFQATGGTWVKLATSHTIGTWTSNWTYGAGVPALIPPSRGYYYINTSTWDVWMYDDRFGGGWSDTTLNALHGAGDPTSSPTANGTMYLNTTSKHIFVWDGASWVNQGYIASAPFTAAVPHDVLASRSSNTTYQNLTGTSMTVNVSGTLSCVMGGPSVPAYISPNTPMVPVYTMSLERCPSTQTSGTFAINQTFHVPPNYYYAVENYSVITAWVETY